MRTSGKILRHRLRASRFACPLIACLCISATMLSQEASARTTRAAADLLVTLLSPQTPDDQWLDAEKSFERLTPNVALPILFAEIAKGIPGGYSYAAYNCFDPRRDRKAGQWGRFCVVNSLWCRQLACPQTRQETEKQLLELWANPISVYGQSVLLEELCVNPAAESRIAILFRDQAADIRLRTQAAICLLRQDDRGYRSEVTAFAENAPITYTPPDLHPYPLPLRRVLLEQLASSPPHPAQH